MSIGIDLTFSVPTGALDANDVVADTQDLGPVFKACGPTICLDSITLLDEGDQGAQLSFVFLNDSDQSIGTENSAPNINDTNAAKIIGVASIATTDYLDVGGSKVACVKPALKMWSTTENDLGVALMSSGTPTYGAATALKARFVFSPG